MRSRALGLVVVIGLAASGDAHADPWRFVRVDAPGANADAKAAERAARAYLATHVRELAPGAAPTDFALVANQTDGDLKTVAFVQTWRGLRVIGGQLGFVFSHDRLVAVTTRAKPNVSAAIVPHARDLARSEAWIGRETGRRARARATGELVVVDSGGHYEIAEALDVRALDTPERWTVYASARDGQPLSRETRVMTATGTLAFNAGIRYARGARDDQPAPYVDITVNGAPGTTTTTGTFTWSGSAPATLGTSVVGTYVHVVNAGAGGPAAAMLTAQPGATTAWNLATDEDADAQLSTYIYANRAKARARIVNPALATWLDTQLDFTVNEDNACNAYSTGNEVHLAHSTADCENTGRVADIVFHEFGHSVHFHSIIAGMGAFEPNLSEGLSDFFAANITEDSGVGRGFHFDDSPLRQIDPSGTERMYPADFDFDPHVSGLIIGGALWDLRKALVTQLGHAAGVAQTEKIYTGIMQRADDISTAHDAALLADDDDGDVTNGTPHFCAIEDAFGRHGLVPGYQTTTAAPPVLDDLHISVATTTPTATSCPPPSVSTVTVTWKVGDGVASQFELSPDGTTWAGDFPDQPNGTVLRYSVDVVYSDGTAQVYPNNDADPLYQVMIGKASPIWCEPMDADPMWDQTSNEGLEWQWGMLAAAGTSPDPTTPKTGTGVLGTDVMSDGSYRNNLVATVSTPTIIVSRYARVHLQYWRWLTVEDARFDQATIRANNTEVWKNAYSPNGTLDHVDREWRFHDIDVTNFAQDGTMQITWGLSTDFSKELGGWTLDDVCFVGLDSIGRCGDSIIEEGEQCDDGSTERGDGCDEHCQLEPVSGGGACSSTRGSDGWLLGVGAALYLCRRRSRSAPSRSVSDRMPK